MIKNQNFMYIFEILRARNTFNLFKVVGTITYKFIKIHVNFFLWNCSPLPPLRPPFGLKDHSGSGSNPDFCLVTLEKNSLEFVA